MRKKLFLTICLLSLVCSAMGQAKLGFVAWDFAGVLQNWRAQGYNYNYTTESGVFIEYILINGSAYKAGLKPYDVITAIDNKKVADYYEFERIMNQKKVITILYLNIQIYHLQKLMKFYQKNKKN